MNYSYSYNAGGGAAAAILIVVWIIAMIFAILAIIGLWKTFNKAGLPGWAAIIPFYNEYNVVKLSNRPTYFFWIMLGCSLFAWIPLLGWLLMIGLLVLWIFMALDIAANFGQGTGFAILLIIFPSIMFLILGFGHYQFNRIAEPGSAGFGAPPMPAGSSYAAVPPPPPAAPQVAPPVPAAPPLQAAPPVAPPLQAAPPAAPPVAPPLAPPVQAAPPVAPPVLPVEPLVPPAGSTPPPPPVQ